jgi:DNA-binding Lrp family transcriptional regulator
MDETDVKLLKAVQNGLLITKRPYQALGDEIGMSEDEVLHRITTLLDEGVIRRFAAAIGHRALGITANAMIVWIVPNEDIDKVGRIVASFEEVTHCYERTARPKWPYNLYAMIHSQNKENCIRIAFEISKAIGILDHKILFSEKEYKKTSARI